MELSSNMDKKNQRTQGTLVKNGQEPNGKFVQESASKKNGNNYPRKREIENGRNALPKRGGRQSMRYARPREKMGCQVESVKQDFEFGSLQHGGGKKQNIAHLLNWWGSSPNDRHGRRLNSSAPYYTKTRKSYSQRYNKEHFVQANCQFVVRDGEDYSTLTKDPDNLINWDFVEEVRLHVSDDESCPICLHTPSAAKVTRCGHVYCFSCILHYLALSDDKWRKCPICYEPVGKEDLKSVVVILHKDFHPGDIVEMQLMRRERDSMIPCPVSCYDPDVKINDVVSLNHPSHILAHAKFVEATGYQVIEHILNREQKDLERQLSNEGDEPEACFIQEALALVSSRQDFLSHFKTSQSNSCPDFSTELLDGNCNSANFCSNFDRLSLNTSFLNNRENSDKLSKISDSSDSLAGIDYSLRHNSVSKEMCGPQLNDRKSRGDPSAPKSTFYFYQAVNGSHTYLHSINSRMLIKQFGSLEMCPLKISGKMIEKQPENMTAELRSRLRNLGHLPVTCPFDLVEIEMPPGLISKEVLGEFQAHLDAREKNRRKRLKNEAKVERRFQKEEDRLMGRSTGGKNVHLSSYKHFPTFVEEDPNPSVGHYPTLGGGAIEPKLSSSSESDVSFSSFARAISRSNPSGLASPPKSHAWPTLSGGAGGTWPCQSAVNRSGKMELTSVADSDDESVERPPNFNASFSDAFAKALDSAVKKDSGEPEARRGKKSKKKKGIVLLSSGGFH